MVHRTQRTGSEASCLAGARVAQVQRPAREQPDTTPWTQRTDTVPGHCQNPSDAPETAGHSTASTGHSEQPNTVNTGHFRAQYHRP
eukprot:7397595-Alexandrium_andersonii.AAC.1